MRVEIPDYKVKKLEYDTVNIALCCDNSGSMEGEKIENLKKAVSTFVGKLADEVNIGYCSIWKRCVRRGR